MVANREARDPRPHIHHDAGTLMTEDRRKKALGVCT